VQHDFDFGVAGAARDLRRRPRVGELILHVAKAGLGGGSEALEEVELRKQRREIRGEPGHRASIPDAC
jgi:hypothetical protein